ncbi:GNAT family N-acetyltransferase [Tamlana haliotis]|uniref:GNAT family N-acetyltransferase n=1 Tax=Pseudotamlana haliotis TaxID=2614804 RepID=A0A6N6MJN1_9FLAO|nr:GNAT family N-acetyltransferase [Tamlana haliotis]KAB1071352.1 GNAT family N-acetyltransferase [Tamlana haliotis]
MIKYRLATSKDNQQLLELTRSAGMPGKMALRIDRYPDFFKLNKLRGATTVYVATDGANIVGCICVSDQNVYINKQHYPLYYISDFKVSKTHRHLGIGLELTNTVVKYLETQNADLVFLNVAKGNKRPFVFFSDRGHYPDFQNIGTFTTFQYIGKKKKLSNKKYKIELSRATSEVIEFLNDYYSQYELASIITNDKIKDTDLYVVREQNQILAVMALIDTMEMKQNVVLKMPWHLKGIIAFINVFCQLFKLSKLPKENEPIKMLYVRYLAIKVYDKALVSALISFAKQQAYNKSYAFVSISLHENDNLLQKLPKFMRFTFNSVGMLVSMKDNNKLMEMVNKGMPFRDYSTI